LEASINEVKKELGNTKRRSVWKYGGGIRRRIQTSLTVSDHGREDNLAVKKKM